MLVQVSTSDIESYGLSFEFTTVTRLLANKLSNMCVSREEYVLLKTLVLLNSGEFHFWKNSLANTFVIQGS